MSYKNQISLIQFNGNPGGKQVVKTLKKELLKAATLGHSNYKLPFCLYMKIKEMF